MFTPELVFMFVFALDTELSGTEVTHGFMLKRSLPASGFAALRVDPLSAPLLSVQVAAPPADPLGEVRLVGLVGEEAFLPWISCTCFGLDTATD